MYQASRSIACILLVAMLPLVDGCAELLLLRQRAMTDKAIREKNGEFVLAGTICDESGMPMDGFFFDAAAWQQCFWPDDSPMCTGSMTPPHRAISGNTFHLEFKESQSARLVFYKPGYETQAIIYALEGHELPPGSSEPRPPAVVTHLSGPKKFEKTDLRVVMRRLGPHEKQSDAPGPGFLHEGPLVFRPGVAERLRPATLPATRPRPATAG